jgi:hypothetical protein
MKQELDAQKYTSILQTICTLPQKMVALYEQENVSEFVLHELCQDYCFNFDRAAYLVDNPDFNCLKGIAGFCKSECFSDKKNMWKNPALFNDHMKRASFNQQVRDIFKESLRKKGERDSQIVQEMAQELAMKNYSFFSWDMRNANHGILMYETGESSCVVPNECLVNGLSLLSFCPIF